MRRAMTPEVRRRVMSSIKSERTKPEREVRSALRRRGVRYSTHLKTLPGRPDIVVRQKRLAIFVHGCLWHLHEGCPLKRVPKSRPEYWPAKLARNTERDMRNFSELLRNGWTVAVVWECETADPAALAARLDQIFA